jgi:NAD(P)H-flavin reductase
VVKTIENGEEKYRRVCVDGPVFDAASVAWDS